MMNSMRKLFVLLIIFSCIGLAISLYSFLHNQGFASGEFCTIGESLNCDIVNKGPFSQIFGIPIAFIGLIGYGFLFIASILKYRNPVDHQLTFFLLFASIAGFLFSVYLTSLEAFALHVWCLVCLASQITIAIIAVFALLIQLKEKKICN